MLNYKIPEFNFIVPEELCLRKEEVSKGISTYRSNFMRDRDRIMYCSSFRRLSGKTQIYLIGTNDNQRNRLTHTLEVSQIARTISQALLLDTDLTEAIALGHDLGHTPFGHAGEQILHEIMMPNSPVKIKNSPMNQLDRYVLKNEPLFGFKHNVQSVRVVTMLEKYHDLYGLNLTNFTLWGILHHSEPIYKAGRVNVSNDPNYRTKYHDHYRLPNQSGKEAWSFEAFVVAKADEIAQWHHDLEDALRGRAMSGSEVCEAIREALHEQMHEEDLQTLVSLEQDSKVDQRFISNISRIVVNTLVNWLVECSLYNLDRLHSKYSSSPDNELCMDDFIAEHSYDESEIQNAISFNKVDDESQQGESIDQIFSRTISKKIHHSREVERMNAKGQYIIRKLFQAYYSNPQQLDDSTIIRYMQEHDAKKEKRGIGATRADFESFRTSEQFDLRAKIDLMRSICDQISGMTDRYAISEYESLYG